MSSNLLMMTPSERAGKRVASGSGVYKPKAYRTKGADVASLVNASVTVTGGNSIYVFGGFDQYTDEVYNHVLKLDLQTYTWSLIDNYGDIPCVRMGHTSIYWRDNKLIVFGGENDQRAFLNDVYFFDIDTATWSRPIVHGIPPRGRSRHAVTIYDDKLFVVGGSNGLQVLDDICYLDLRTMTWSRSWTFVSRFDHQCWVWEGKLWVFGGLTQEMDRTAELVWLDISNSPTFSNPSLPGTPSGTSVGGIMSQLHLQSRPHLHHSQSSPARHQSPGGSQQQPSIFSMQNSQPALSGSRPSPTPPGATAAIKFTSGPNIPSEATGTHFHHVCGNTLLDFITPANTIRPSETSLSALDLKTFTWRKLADGPDVFVGPGYRWNYLAMSHDSTNAYLLGCASEGPENDYLSEVLPIDLRRYGMTLETTEGENPTHGLLGSDMASIFDVDPANSRTNTGIAGDFIVRAIRDEACQDDGDPKWASASTSAIGTPQDEAVELPLTAGAASSVLENIHQDHHSPPIHVHRLILAARWPHFARMYNARMSEFHLNNLYIPEPYSVVRAFLYYLYTDSIAPSKYCTNISTVAGLLVMSNIYGIPRLRALAVGRLSREMDIESAAIVWERAGVAGEEGLRKQAAKYCLQYWGRVVRTRAFRGLSRDGLVGLCAEVDLEGRVVCGPGEFDGEGERRERGRVMLGEEVVEDEDDDEEGEGEGMEGVDAN